VKEVFAKIWNTPDLLVSFDVFICWRPWWPIEIHKKKKRRKRNDEEEEEVKSIKIEKEQDDAVELKEKGEAKQKGKRTTSGGDMKVVEKGKDSVERNNQATNKAKQEEEEVEEEEEVTYLNEKDNRRWEPQVEGLHCDQNPHKKPGFECVQGEFPQSVAKYRVLLFLLILRLSLSLFLFVCICLFLYLYLYLLIELEI
tara:strand:- start:346 stop:939 length:594 start_codon:yes stop_codon:yes gene_type:complete